MTKIFFTSPFQSTIYFYVVTIDLYMILQENTGMNFLGSDFTQQRILAVMAIVVVRIALESC